MGNKLLGDIFTGSEHGNSTLILLLAQIYKLDSKAIDFVLAFPQAKLDVNIWMYLPIGFQVDTDNESKQSHLLKLNKSLYGLKQASLNWFKKLKQGHIEIDYFSHKKQQQQHQTNLLTKPLADAKKSRLQHVRIGRSHSIDLASGGSVEFHLFRLVLASC